MMWPSPPSSPRRASAPSDKARAAERERESAREREGGREHPPRRVNSPLNQTALIVAAEETVEAIAQIPPRASTSAVGAAAALLSASIDASCSVDVSGVGDEPLPYAPSSAAAARHRRHEQQARELHTPHTPTCGNERTPCKRMAYPSQAPALGTVDAPTTLNEHLALERKGALTTINDTISRHAYAC
jgi:hypothetical protein